MTARVGDSVVPWLTQDAWLGWPRMEGRNWHRPNADTPGEADQVLRQISAVVDPIAVPRQQTIW